MLKGLDQFVTFFLPDNEMKLRKIQNFHFSDLSLFYGFCGKLLCGLLSRSSGKAVNLLLF